MGRPSNRLLALTLGVALLLPTACDGAASDPPDDPDPGGEEAPRHTLLSFLSDARHRARSAGSDPRLLWVEATRVREDGTIELDPDIRRSGGVQFAFLVGDRILVLSYVPGREAPDGSSPSRAELPVDPTIDRPLPAEDELSDSPAIMEMVRSDGVSSPASIHVGMTEEGPVATVVGGAEARVELPVPTERAPDDSSTG